MAVLHHLDPAVLIAGFLLVVLVAPLVVAHLVDLYGRKELTLQPANSRVSRWDWPSNPLRRTPVMAETTEADILKAVQRLDDKLSKALKEQTDTLTKRIEELAHEHSSSLLEQERRNATFATITRMEEIGKHYHRIGGIVQESTLRQAQLIERVTKLEGKPAVQWQRWALILAAVGSPIAVVISHLWR